MATPGLRHVRLDHGGGDAAPWLDLNLGPDPEWASDAKPGVGAVSPGTVETCDEDPDGSSSSSSSSCFVESGYPEPRNIRLREALPGFLPRAGSAQYQRPHVRCPSCGCQRDPSKENGDIRSTDMEILPLSSRKRRGAAEVPKIAEKRRRDRFNQNIKTLQKIVPNSSKGDKISILERAIAHLKQLQAQRRMLEYLRVTSPAMALAQHRFLHAMPAMVPVSENPPVRINIQAAPMVLGLPYFYL